MTDRGAILGGILAVTLLAGCGQSPAPRRVSRPAKPAPRLTVTDLRVSIANHRQFQRTCAGIPPRRYIITLDGREVASVDVPCATGFQAPAPVTTSTPFPVGPGRHRIGVRDVAGGIEAFRDLGFPVLQPIEDDSGRPAGHLLADRLLVDADDDRLEIGEPRALIIRL